MILRSSARGAFGDAAYQTTYPGTAAGNVPACVTAPSGSTRGGPRKQAFDRSDHITQHLQWRADGNGPCTKCSVRREQAGNRMRRRYLLNVVWVCEHENEILWFRLVFVQAYLRPSTPRCARTADEGGGHLCSALALFHGARESSVPR